MQTASCTHFGQMAQNPVIDHRGAQIMLAGDGNNNGNEKDRKYGPAKFLINPENTLAAIEASFKMGHDAELDIHSNGEDSFQRQGKTVEHQGQTVPFLPLYHDNELGDPRKISGNPFHTVDPALHGQRLRDLPTAAIQTAKLDLKALIERVIAPRLGTDKGFQPGTPDSFVNVNTSEQATRIPTLDEVFTLLKKYPDNHLYVEIKTVTQGAEEKMKGVEEKLVRLIKLFGVQHQVTVISFNRFALERAREEAKKLGQQALTFAYDVEPESYLVTEGSRQETLSWASRHVQALLPAYEDTDASLIRDAHKLGLKVIPWVYREDRLRERQMIPKMMADGADGIITNVPSDADQVLGRLRKPSAAFQSESFSKTTA
jgi:glycerophosphoryl diester phosphodiesterase